MLRRVQLPRIALAVLDPGAASGYSTTHPCASPGACLAAAMGGAPCHPAPHAAPSIYTQHAAKPSVAPGRPPRNVVLKNLRPDIADAVAERRACCVLQLLRACGNGRGLLVPYGYMELLLNGRLFSATVMAQCCGGTLHELLYKL